MSKKEFAIFVSALKTYYPKEEKILPNVQAVELWFTQLKDIPYNVAECALNKWVALNKWSPTIADIRQLAAEMITGNNDKDWGQAWKDVLMAVRLYGSYQVNDAFNSLDELTRETVKRIGFIKICMSENTSVERASFRDIYVQLQRRHDEDKQLPEELRKMISEMPLMIEK